MKKIIVTGGAGLLGQNLITLLAEQGFTNIIAMDKNASNLAVVKKLHPAVETVLADLSQPGDWKAAFVGAQSLFLLQAQITGSTFAPFQKNTLDSTAQVLDAARQAGVPFTVFIGSSVVNSVADDNYTRSKRAQEQMVDASALPHCTVRPTLMFGWFDPKHLGWLSRLMAKIPVFPIPGSGEYLRQPLYVRDFCKVLLWCATHPEQASGKVYDIVGQQDVNYIDIIRTIKKVKRLHTAIVKLPVPLFRFLMRAYGVFSKNPPFVADQLDALMAGDYFSGEDMRQTFGIVPTPFAEAIKETFTHPVYSRVVLERWE
ncbi:NAD-dependent epimerase/dehydratase family protein [Desulfovibrio aerotolerans]|uniref:NAD-dependent epimerase/dehydratase family protein n=1 Tax=Solidesulfovibrio aerotolerans TaxID=295255 RepID=A0A7C9IPF2_9BACT|nr:NAD-dependent epimerase/dehydratase family protein [Solidesulfovibrio aerotolerans]MYL85206.1 NAD-dependent epimerase/dehydratase family protein [Solidesulfovibrio aerotolerans]